MVVDATQGGGSAARTFASGATKPRRFCHSLYICVLELVTVYVHTYLADTCIGDSAVKVHARSVTS